MKKITILATCAALALGSAGCKQLKGLLPVIADIIGDIARAQDALKTIDGVVQGYFAVAPNKEMQERYGRVKAAADDSMSALLKVAQGAEQASNEDIDKAWKSFQGAYTDIVMLLGRAGFGLKFYGHKDFKAGTDGKPTIEIPKPEDMKRTK